MDSSINDAMADPSMGGGNESEICAPLDAFGIDGTPPAEGDEVEFTTKGVVTRVDGTNAYVTPSEVNGQPVMQDGGGMSGMPDENELAQNAQELDKQQYATGGVVPPNVTPLHQKAIKRPGYDPHGGVPTPDVPYNRYSRIRSG